MKVTRTHFHNLVVIPDCKCCGKRGSGIPLIGDRKYDVVRTLGARSWGCRNARLHSHMLSGMTVIAEKSGLAYSKDFQKKSTGVEFTEF